MINFNGDIVDPTQLCFTAANRAFKYGDAVFETMKYANGKIIFLEDHYFRLMTTMRILRMEIPMTFSPEYLENQINETIAANHQENNANRVRLSVFREGSGKYMPETNEVSFLIETEVMPNSEFTLNAEGLKIDLFKDFYKQKSLLSTLKSANAQLYVLASIYKAENKLQECILINDDKEVVEAISSNLFMLKDGIVYTPPVESGCLKGVMRKNLIALLKQMKIELKEEAFSPFELQKADELWLTNAVNGLQWVGNYRKKQYTNTLAKQMIVALNEAVS